MVQHIFMWNVTKHMLHFLNFGTATIKLHKIFPPLNLVMDFSSPFYKPASDVHWQSGPRGSRSPRARKNVSSNIEQRFSFKLVLQFIHLVVCLTTEPKPLPKRALHIVRSRASSFKWEYPLLSLRSSNSILRLLPCLPVTSIPSCSKTLPVLNKVIIKCTVHYIVNLRCTFSVSLVRMKARNSDVLA